MIRVVIYLLRPFYLVITYLFGLFRNGITPPNTVGYVLDTSIGLFVVGIEDMGVGKKLARDGTYGKEELERILNLVDDKSNVLFVGGHVGALAIPTGRNVKEVTVIEPNPSTFRLLESNIALNRASNITALPIAANDKKQDIQFVLNRTNSGISKRMPIKKPYRYFYDQPQVINVASDRLDDLLEGKAYNLIIMDIEGSEYFALMGMPSLLKSAEHLIVEFRPHHLKSVSGVTLAEFLSVILPYFGRCYIPSKNITLTNKEAIASLREMYENGEFDDGLIFSKNQCF